MYDPVFNSVPTYRCARTPANPSTAILFLPSYRSSPSPSTRLSLNESLAELGTALAGRQTDIGLGGGLLNSLIGLSEDELDVARLAHVRVDLFDWSASTFPTSVHLRLPTYTTVGTVGSAPVSRSLVNLDTADDKVGGVEALGIGVGLGVLEKAVMGSVRIP